MSVPDEKQLWEALSTVIDPEIGINIVDLGLVYSVDFRENGVSVTMTLTTPGCPMQEPMKEGVRSVLARLPDVESVEVNIVWDPPWNPERMSDVARKQLNEG